MSKCSVCSGELLGEEEFLQPADILYVQNCNCCVHKVCFLEILALQIAAAEWFCPGCAQKPVCGYTYVPSSSESERAEYVELPIKHAYLISTLPTGLAPDRAIPIPMGSTSAGLTPMQRDYLSQPKEWREKNCYFIFSALLHVCHTLIHHVGTVPAGK
jgi:hypothetical protein